MVNCVCTQWGDSNENTQYNFMLKKIEKISLLCLLTWRYDWHTLGRTTPVSNIFSWFQRCSSHCSSTVCLNQLRNSINLQAMIVLETYFILQQNGIKQSPSQKLQSKAILKLYHGKNAIVYKNTDIKQALRRWSVLGQADLWYLQLSQNSMFLPILQNLS